MSIKTAVFLSLLILQAIICFDISAQASNQSLNIIPNKYEMQFKEDQKIYLAYTRPSEDSSNKAYALLEKTKAGIYKEYNIDSLANVWKSLSKKRLLRKIDFIKQNPNRYVSLYYFHQQFLNSVVTLDADSLASIYANLSDELKSTSLGQSVEVGIKRRLALRIDKEMPVFSFKTSSGDSVNLLSFREKNYVLLCFWASWCKPCKENIPLLNRINNDFSSKGLRLVSVSLDDDETKWRMALEKYPMSWMQTSYLPSYVSVSKLDSLYDLRYIPQYFLIDKQGKLIYHNVLSKDEENGGYNILRDILRRELLKP